MHTSLDLLYQKTVDKSSKIEYNRNMEYSDTFKVLLAKARIRVYEVLEVEDILEYPSINGKELDYDIPYIAQQLLGDSL